MWYCNRCEASVPIPPATHSDVLLQLESMRTGGRRMQLVAKFRDLFGYEIVDASRLVDHLGGPDGACHRCKHPGLLVGAMECPKCECLNIRLV